MRLFSVLSFVVSLSIGLTACSSDSEPAGGAGGSSGSGGADAGAAGDAAATESGTDSGAGDASEASADSAGSCLAEGIYGSCKDNPGCFCLQGGTVYQVCSTNCQDATECGSASALNGGTPVCAPINPGAGQKICALVCTDTSQCPCGLVCMPSGVPNTNICAELQ